MKKFNIIDIGVIVLFVLLIAVATLKASSYKATKSDGTMDKIEYQMLVANLREYSSSAFKIGDAVYDSQTKVNIGTIKDIKIENNRVKEDTNSGDIAYVDKPEKYDVTLTIETDGLETENAYFADRSVELKVGSDKQFETLYIKTNGTVKGIKVIK